LGLRAYAIRIAALVSGLVATAFAAYAPGAEAATATVEETVVVLRSDPGHGNRISVWAEPGGVRLADGSEQIVAGDGCTSAARGNGVVCRLDAVTGIRVEPGDGDDGVQVDANVGIPVTILGAAGNDRLSGGSGPDVVDGGPGEDELRGEAGDDRLEARDGELDNVDCGADAHDLAVTDMTIPLAPVPGDGVDGCTEVRRGLVGGEGAVVAVSPSDRRAGLVYIGVPGVANQLQVTVRGSAFEIFDATGVVAAGNCTRPDPADRRRVLCPRTGVRSANLRLGDGDDRAVVRSAGGHLDTHQSLSLAGEAGSDFLEVDAVDAALDGGPGADTVVGGEGDDVLQGGEGDDRLLPGGGADTVDLASPLIGDPRTVAAGRDTIDLRDGAPDRYACDRSDRGAVTGDWFDARSNAPCKRWIHVGDTRPRAAGVEILTPALLRENPRLYITIRVRCAPGHGACRGGMGLAESRDVTRVALRPGRSRTLRIRTRYASFRRRHTLVVITHDERGRTRTERKAITIVRAEVSFSRVT
jgi:hypothetical protein